MLAQRGLVRLDDDDDDARVRLVSITEEGARALVGALERWRAVQDLIEARFGAQRLAAPFLDALDGRRDLVAGR